ncbi:outer membrane protein assembly factor BamC [Vibrio sp. 10N.261.55.A7]|uniref:outer membrane protein assembly factor BamC n=1 Tax=Vibrio sp. 10N.261.55.A7 TaxID=1880851 RepID=UPI000C82E66F|nr:outer membrane protein assembly factor BamC [Vibrio sp. 10N.261.55.A7]PMK04987.1 outer membrane assembly protein BamC [Vibrio sp. 10N.261.55.A7]
MKFSRQLVMTSLAVLVLSACSSDPSSRRQAKDDFEYMDTPEFTEWKFLEGAEPNFYDDYEIPKGDFNGELGQAVDIRPPQQILELVPGARVESTNSDVTLWLLKKEEADKVWETALIMLEEQNIKLREQTEKRVETDWTTWESEDEDTVLGSRTEFTHVESNNRYGFKVALIEWREDNTIEPVSATNKERYNVLLTNLVMARYDLELREEAARKAEELVKQIPITMGTDRSGLPVIIARTPYNVMWQRLPTLLPEMGFTIEGRNQSQGNIKAKYAAPDDDFWEDIGVKPVELKGGTYTFLFGDLGNRTSINVTDSAGKPVEEQLLMDMAPVIAAMVEKQ